MNTAPAKTTPGARQPAAPYDRMAAALAVLSQAAQDIAPGMVPVVDFYPDRAVVLNNVSVAAGTTSQALNFTFPTDGYVVGIRATTEDGLAASMAGVLLRVQIDGRDDFWSSGAGNGAGFAPFAQISGQNSGSRGSYPIKRQFCQANAWTLFVMNTTGGAVVCDIVMDVVDTRNPPP
jgi:hypothetical protein